MKNKGGKRKHGRPKRRWVNCIKGEMEMIGVCEDDANDKKRWSKMIHTGGNPTCRKS